MGVVERLPPHPFTAREAKDAGVPEHRLYGLLDEGRPGRSERDYRWCVVGHTAGHDC
ncbi:hypothetical protein [Cellulomonas bogoriensis]|uniref:hypothetical protein n=1 Tax=Cellulomonas bogoriensis TaxID=301388 RepID=UPI000AC8C69D|nr:hypothetical protein [Cellulomonas bogoriensis]